VATTATSSDTSVVGAHDYATHIASYRWQKGTTTPNQDSMRAAALRCHQVQQQNCYHY